MSDDEDHNTHSAFCTLNNTGTDIMDNVGPFDTTQQPNIGSTNSAQIQEANYTEDPITESSSAATSSTHHDPTNRDAPQSTSESNNDDRITPPAPPPQPPSPPLLTPVMSVTPEIPNNSDEMGCGKQ